MSAKSEIIRGTLILLVFLAFAVWVLVRWIKRSKDDPTVLIVKWILTGGLGAILVACGLLMRSDSSFKVTVPWICVFCGFVFAILWTPNIATALLKPLTSAMDGGDEPPEPRPLYSVARAKRKRGRYAEALADVRQQLMRFPTDVEGQMLAAEILAEEMNDLQGAEIVIQRLCEQPGHAPLNLAFALNCLADWHLKYAQDPEAARRVLERIPGLCPNTEMALSAAQRIAHLADADSLLAPYDRPRIGLRRGVENLGLLQDQSHLKPVEADPAHVAAQYVEHLRQHPLDTEAREKLALIYADHYGRLDLATDQLEQMIQQPHQPAKQVVHWLNVLADLQVRAGYGYEVIAATLERIMDLYPGGAVAENARSRLNHLKLELKAREAGQVVKLGSYEQDLGLKQGLPSQR